MVTLTALSAETLEKLRGRLRADRRAATTAIDSTKQLIASFLASRRGVEVDDEHDPEGGTLASQFAESSALLENSRRHLDQVNAALGRMATGSCERCGADIPIARLEARPHAAYCVRCAQASGA